MRPKRIRKQSLQAVVKRAGARSDGACEHQAVAEHDGWGGTTTKIPKAVVEDRCGCG
jgi:hypothetical protein